MGALDGSLTIPKVGAVPKKPLALVVGAAAAFVGWRYYQARSGAGTDEAEAPSDFADGGLPPGVIGAVPPNNAYGGDTGDTGDVGDGHGATPTTNAAWANQAATQLSQSETWSYTDIVTALGAYLAGIPLSTGQQAIVRAAIAIAGYPPVGTHSIVPGGNTPITIAPSGFTATATGPSTASLSAGAVAGAASYRAYRNGTVAGTSSSPSFTIGSLTAGSTSSWSMRAVSASGEEGPSSSSVSLKQPADSGGGTTPPSGGAGAPNKAAAPRATSIKATTAVLSTTAVKGATSYAWYVDGVPHGASKGPTGHTVAGLKGKTNHYATVSAHANGKAGAMSNRTTFKTK